MKKKLNLLIIEDSQYDTDLMINELRKNNLSLEYQLVNSADQMMLRLSSERYDLVISDFNLPGFTGVEALKLAKDHDPMLPFILISGYINRKQETQILELGANEVILKDNLNRLPFAVRRVLYEIADKKKLNTLIATKDKLFSVLSHDLKGTLEGIVVLTEFLHEDVSAEQEDSSLANHLKLIAQGVRSSSRLLDNLLNWALMQQEGFEPTYRQFDLKKSIKSSIDIYRSKAMGKNVSVHVHSPPVSISGDVNMMGITFRNLISNAIKFSNPGGKIDIMVTENKDVITVSVKDQGIGIPADIKSKLFDPEDRPKRAGTDQEQSTGLGLLLCNDIVKMHQGSISFESEEGKGSAFTIMLPRERKAPVEKEQTSMTE